MLILGFQKTTLLDYPEHIASTVFTGECNFRCPFCHNKDIVFASKSIQSQTLQPYSEEEVLQHLQKRKNVLTGVCITGGEPTLQPDLTEFLTKIKALGYQIKLDTNGYRPDTLISLVQGGLVDYVAMDIKNSPKKYAQTIGLSSCDISNINRSIDYLIHGNHGISYEFRTTIVAELHTEEDMREIATWLQGANAYYLQSYTESEQVIAPGYHAHSRETLLEFLNLCQNHIPNTFLRGID
ncbi:MAG: anaerobic ribonucleoside-triphosphate reductase activating protein [Agathobacter sp.]|nr:anaerobic ribonucleoside-triphosphate reductase activating protein [Agathobacter sp.]